MPAPPAGAGPPRSGGRGSPSCRAPTRGWGVRRSSSTTPGRSRGACPERDSSGPWPQQVPMLDLGSYPGLIDGEGTVRGEVYRIDAEEVLHALDREEGYNFDRRPATVTLASGRRARAWVYWYRGPQQRAVAIPHGDYRRARPAGDHP